MSSELTSLDATQMASGIQSKSISPVDLIEAHLRRIELLNPQLNAVVTLNPSALDEARQAERILESGDPVGPLHGVPFTIKDCVDTRGIRTTRGSKIFANHLPGEDATVVTRLRRAGGILIGKTNMPEFALWWETSNTLFGRTENPWKHGRTPGGSSGGESSSIVVGMSPLGIGSDLGGSIRQPANYCGIVGLKPTHGRVPLTGHWPDTLLRFMHVGPMARSVRDIALSLSVIAGPDGRDHYAMPAKRFENREIDTDVSQLRIGWTTGVPFEPVSAEVKSVIRDAAKVFESLGCYVEEMTLNSMAEVDPVTLTTNIYAAEGGHYLAPFIAGREGELSPNIAHRMQLPTPKQEIYLDAIETLERLRAQFAATWDTYDILLCPAGPVPAHPHEQSPLLVDNIEVNARSALRATIPFDLTGSPAISIPYGWSSEGLPIGIQLVGRHFDEATLLRAAAAIEPHKLKPERRPQLLGFTESAS